MLSIRVSSLRNKVVGFYFDREGKKCSGGWVETVTLTSIPPLQTWLNSLADQHQSLSTERHGKTEAEAAGYKQ